ncbi:MAG: extracellular solute-binding protein [Ruminococcaceae bacterium]|nr:extracellular solute-binding protein [Oscillospiraceae bacterium]
MKMMKRLLCIALAVLMVLAITACTPENPNPTTGNDDPKPTDGSTSNGKYDFGGKTLKIAIWYEPEIPTLGNTDGEDAWYYSLRDAAEEFNCEIEWIVDTQEAHFSNFIQKSLNGEVYADIMMCHSWNYVSLIQQGLILPTTEYIANSEDPERWESGLYNLNGENWGLMPANNYYMPTYYYLVNTKLLNSLGLENPQELARRGEWTWEAFRDYCLAATDPAKEQYGVACFMLANNMKTSNDFDFAVRGEDGLYYNGFTYEGTKDKGMEILEMIETMALEDKSVLGDWTDGQEAMNAALNAFKDGKVLFAFYPTPSTLKNSGFEDYSVVTVPQGPSSTGLCDTVEAFAFWSLPTYSEFSAEARAAFWMEAKRTWDPDGGDGYYEDDPDDVIEELLDESYINRSDVEFMLEMGAKTTFKPANLVSWGSIIADGIFGEVIRGNSTPAAVVESTAGEVQSLIDATYNKDK